MVSGVIYRKMVFSDIFYCSIIEQNHFNYNTTIESDVYDVLSEKSCSFVCLINENIVGFSKTTAIDQEKIEILILIVENSHRNQRIGKNLLNHTVNKAKHLRFNEIQLFVATSNKIALELYKSVGFKVVNLIKNAYKDKSDAYKMILKL
ncbi:hypothetical protein NUSPORA_01352 [Nucleospora cyclopteri]